MSDDFTRAAAALAPSEFDPLAGRVMAAAELDAGQAVAANVRARARRHRRSGVMESRISVKVDGTGIRQEVRVHAGGKVAHLIIGGTRSHAIRARSHALPITRGGRSAVSFAMSVHHPGTRPDPFVAEAVAASQADIAKALDDAGAELVDGLARAVGGR